MRKHQPAEILGRQAGMNRKPITVFINSKNKCMNLHANLAGPTRYRRVLKLLLIMKLSLILIICCVFQVSAIGYAQQITLKQNGITLKSFFKEIKRQTGYDVIYADRILNDEQKVNVHFQGVALQQALNTTFQNLQIDYTIDEMGIVLSKKVQMLPVQKTIDVKGVVMDENSVFKEGVTVKVKETGKTIYTNKFGQFEFKGIEENTILVFSHLGYNTLEVKASSNLRLVKLIPAESRLDEVQVMAYGETSRRKATGNITKVSGEDIRMAPVSNPILALQGLVPGLEVMQANGMPGSGVKLQIRGRKKIDKNYGADDSPLIIIDGLPTSTGTTGLNQMTSAISNLNDPDFMMSPFMSLNAGDIESIEVLKDADATAIYGSRGASGAILITTKKGKPGSINFSGNLTSGISKARLPDMLNLKEYLAMRKEAFKNDNIPMTGNNAYDLLEWDTTRNSNLVKEMVGSTAHYSTAQANLSGGSELSSFNLSGAYTRETIPYPTEFPNTKGNVGIGLSTKSNNRKFFADFRGSYGFVDTRNISSALNFKLPPHIQLYNEDGSLAWNEGGVFRYIQNPLANLHNKYIIKTMTLAAKGNLKYKFTDALSLSVNMGYDLSKTEEQDLTYQAAINPMRTDKPKAAFAFRQSDSYIIEPLLEYKRAIGKGNLALLAAGTLQSQTGKRSSYAITNYTSDEFVGSLMGITNTSFVSRGSSDSEYKYLAWFGRATYDYDDKYILNLTVRRDGSSRFGPDYRFSTFGAIGGAWNFSNETFLSNDVLSFGKIRASYGHTGNDNIGDYKFLDLYGPSVIFQTYNGSLALKPQSLFRRDLHWELSKKIEIATELGFFKDRLLFTAAVYRERSKDPLVQIPVSLVTGFSTVVSNLNDVIVQNKGLELSLEFKNLQKKDLTWSTSVNVTIPDNKLIEFPNLDSSPYATRYVIGKSLNIAQTLMFLGVDPATGYSMYKDANGDGKVTISLDANSDTRYQFDTDPIFYGGLFNRLRFKNMHLNFVFSFRKEMANSQLSSLAYPLGSVQGENQIKYALNRWQKEGDITDVEKFSNLILNQYMALADSRYVKTFHATLQTLEFGYSVPLKIAKKLGLKNLSISGQAQNLFSFAPFGGFNPMNTSLNLGPFRTYVASLQFNL